MISFVVPVYNARAFLQTCVDSLIRQDVAMEIILVDDGSRDASGALCDELAARDGRIRVIHKENGGVSSARNAGLQAATGEYVWFLDADDWIEPDAGRVMLALADEENADLVVCGMVSDYLSSGESVPMPLVDPGSYRGKDGVAQAFLALERSRLLAFSGNKLYRRAFLEKINARFEQVAGPVEDMLFQFFVVPKAACVALVNEIFLHYVQANSDSMVHRYFEGLFEIGLRVNRERRSLYRELGLESEDAKNVCAEQCFLQDFHSIKNLYRRGGPSMRATRRMVWRRVIGDQEIREEIKRSAALGLTEARLVKAAVSTGSAAAANAFFASLMFARAHMGPAYRAFRRRLIFRKKRG